MNKIGRFIILLLAPVMTVQAGLITLDQWNSTELQSSGDRVQLSWIEGNNILNIQWLDGVASNPVAPVGIDKIGLNYNGTLTFDQAASTAGWGVATGGNNIADFGVFNLTYREPGSNDGIFSAIQLAFNEGIFLQNFFQNSDGNSAVAHVRYDNDCSGFVGDGGPSSTVSSNTACGSTTQLPEPDALLLLVFGMVGLSLSRKMALEE